MRLKTYRFFNMGIDHNYLDDAATAPSCSARRRSVTCP